MLQQFRYFLLVSLVALVLAGCGGVLPQPSSTAEPGRAEPGTAEPGAPEPPTPTSAAEPSTPTGTPPEPLHTGTPQPLVVTAITMPSTRVPAPQSVPPAAMVTSVPSTPTLPPTPRPMPTPPPGIILPTPTPAPPQRGTPQPALPLSVPLHHLQPTVLNFPANDIVYVPGTQRLYASVPSKAGAIGNSITVIDPASGTVGPSIFIGSEPNRLTLSEDGATLWVGLDGAGTMRRFDVATLTPGAHFSVAGAQDPTPLRARDILPLPGDPDTLVLVRGPVSGAGGYTVGVYDNGVMRPNILLDIEAGKSLTLAADQQTGNVFSCLERGMDGVVTLLRIDQRGMVSQPTAVPGKVPPTPLPPFLIGCMPPIMIDGGLLYTGTGQVFDLVSRTLVGTYRGVTPFALNPGAQRAYFLRTSLNEDQRAGLVYVFDQHTFRPVAQIQLPFSLDGYTGLVPWGDDGLVIFNNSQVNRVILLRTSAS